ncbi:MAG: hypothetical protein J6A88_00220 [Oscillospiraceae bacterium]|nr:hypothetical protein [Oscillospiraceae bacterium]
MENNMLLEQDAPITMEALQAYFRANDFSTMVSRYNPSTASSEENSLYLKLKAQFLAAWNQQMGQLTKTKSLRNFSPDAPIRCLEESEEKMVAGTVMEILRKEVLAEQLIDQVFVSMQEPMTAEFGKYARSCGKTILELTEEEFQQAVDAFADEFLCRMMKLLLLVQNVPELTEFLSRNGAHEDFDEDVYRNHDKIDFHRRWDHLRSKVGEMLSLTPAMLEELPSSVATIATDSVDMNFPVAETNDELYLQLLNAFIASLKNETDRQIISLRADGKTQQEIAAALGFADHSAISKRLNRLKQDFYAFMDSRKCV